MKDKMVGVVLGLHRFFLFNKIRLWNNIIYADIIRDDNKFKGGINE